MIFRMQKEPLEETILSVKKGKSYEVELTRIELVLGTCEAPILPLNYGPENFY